MQPVYQPEVLIAQAKEKFDKSVKLTDEKAKEIIIKKLYALQLMTEKCKKKKIRLFSIDQAWF